jgi:hypothetical protein
VEREGRVASLLELTDRSAVERALEEFVELGPDRFRARYGMEPSRDYFLLWRIATSTPSADC